MRGLTIDNKVYYCAVLNHKRALHCAKCKYRQCKRSKGKMLGVPNTLFHFPNQWYDDKYACYL